jgi:hypothetical protein
MVKTGSSALMSVKSIFQQLHNPTTWPAPPERPLRPYSADLRPGVLVPMPVDRAAMDARRRGPGGQWIHRRMRETFGVAD